MLKIVYLYILFFYLKMSKEFILKKPHEANIVTKYGSYLNEIKPKVIYLRTKAKITPTIDKISFEENINLIKEDFLNYIEKEILRNKHLHNTYLSNIDISSKSVKYGKISFLRYDLYLKPIITKTLQKNQLLFTRLSIKIDKKLIKLLKKHKINCI